VVFSLAAGGVASGAALTAASATGTTGAGARPVAPASCVLAGGSIKHVIYLQFDNVHFTRDNPRVPSDLQQLPNLLKFITGSGTLLTHEHTPLIAHTADDIVTSETGLYGDRQGMPIANEYNYYPGKADGSSDTAGSFAYWTDPIVDYTTTYAGKPINDSTTTMVGANGKNAPAPWVPYTRAGCDFGSVAAANTEIENQAPDVAHLFGANSADAKEANNPKLSAKAAADYEGLSVHCALGSAVCAKHHSVADKLPAEAGGYAGYRALFGAKYLDPVMSPTGPVRNLNGQVIKDSSGDVGFPGYDGMIGANALAYTLDMQTHGVPVTFTYLTDMHDSQTTGGGLGPGSAQYESQLRAENAAFGTFFADLAKAGITKANTLFVVTADEGDHFVGGPASPANCNGVTIVCHYKNVGEVDGYLTGMLTAKGVTTPLDVAADSAPVLYVHHQPGRTAASVRTLERVAAALTAKDVATGKTVRVVRYQADSVEMRLLHMITGDPKRTPTVTLFGNPDFWLNGDPTICGAGTLTCEPAGGDAWNHGDIAPEINTTFLGLVGPGVRHLGVDGAVVSNHVDIQPTMLAVLKLRDDYVPDGSAVLPALDSAVLPAAVRSQRALLTRLAVAYASLSSPVEQFGIASLKVSTRALDSTSAGDATYTHLENALIFLASRRAVVSLAMKTDLYRAEIGGHPVSVTAANNLITAANSLIAQAASLA
jgi:hypothetical protein